MGWKNDYLRILKKSVQYLRCVWLHGHSVEANARGQVPELVSPFYLVMRQGLSCFCHCVVISRLADTPASR